MDSEDQRPPAAGSVVAQRAKYVLYAVSILLAILWVLFMAFAIYRSVTVEIH